MHVLSLRVIIQVNETMRKFTHMQAWNILMNNTFSYLRSSLRMFPQKESVFSMLMLIVEIKNNRVARQKNLVCKGTQLCNCYKEFIPGAIQKQEKQIFCFLGGLCGRNKKIINQVPQTKLANEFSSFTLSNIFKFAYIFSIFIIFTPPDIHRFVKLSASVKLANLSASV